MRRTRLAPFAALAALVLLAVVAGTAAGSVSIPLITTARVIAAHLLHQAPPTDAATAAIVYQIRLPRALVAALVGAGLGVSGAAMQGLYRNPLADPGLLGISSGAALGAVTILYGGFAAGDPWRVAGGAFLGALVTAAVVFRLGTRAHRTPVGLLLLAGLAVSNLLSAVISLLLTISHPAMLQLLIGWLMGSLDGRGWPQAAAVALPILLAAAMLCAFGRTLNALATGEEDALALGFDIERHKRYVLALVAVATGVAVS
ncbi:MAG TPA: iron ABC transporter permease, partial [Limnochordia bacterium]|nr:iron ABC transporter permease [Limnochordia bacterium]